MALYCARPNTPNSNPYDLGELEKPLRDRIYTAMLHSPRYARSKVSGLALVSGFRDPGRQWDLRVQRVGRRDACNPARRAVPATAVPYASKHQTREAADLGGVDLPWLIANHRAFGLRRTVPSENWHYEAIGTPTVKIIPYPGKTYDGQPVFPPAPPTPQPTKDWFDMATKEELGIIIDDKLEDFGKALLVTLSEQRAAEKADAQRDAVAAKRDGSLYGWVRAIGNKVGATRDDAIKHDPTV